jgi:hypothetical protein
MRLKIIFDTPEQPQRLQEELKEQGHKVGDDFTVETLAEKFMELQIQPHMFREISDLVKRDKEFYKDVGIEIQDQQVHHDHNDDDDLPKAAREEEKKETDKTEE